MGTHRVFGATVGGFKNESQKNHVSRLKIAHNQTKGLGLNHQSPSKKTSIIKETKFYWSKKIKKTSETRVGQRQREEKKLNVVVMTV